MKEFVIVYLCGLIDEVICPELGKFSSYQEALKSIPNKKYKVRQLWEK